MIVELKCGHMKKVVDLTMTQGFHCRTCESFQDVVDTFHQDVVFEISNKGVYPISEKPLTSGNNTAVIRHY